MVQSGTFQLLGQTRINIIIHKADVLKIAPIEENKGCIIYLKNKVPYHVRESAHEVYKILNLVSA